MKFYEKNRVYNFLTRFLFPEPIDSGMVKVEETLFNPIFGIFVGPEKSLLQIKNLTSGAASYFMSERHPDKMSDLAFRMMTATFRVLDLVRRDLDKRVQTFGIEEGMIVVDYGCGPGRYTVKFAKRVGSSGRVYAVDIQELAAEAVKRKATSFGLKNVEAVVSRGYDSGLPEGIADVVCALDMFFMAKEPSALLAELYRISKPDGTLVLDDGHQPRSRTKEKLADSGLWEIREETKDHLKCRPINHSEQ